MLLKIIIYLFLFKVYSTKQNSVFGLSNAEVQGYNKDPKGMKESVLLNSSNVSQAVYLNNPKPPPVYSGNNNVSKQEPTESYSQKIELLKLHNTNISGNQQDLNTSIDQVMYPRKGSRYLLPGHRVERQYLMMGFEETTKWDFMNFTKAEDYPYAVMLFLFNNKSEYVETCSGSLVALDWVLTAASHCFTRDAIAHIEVYAGGNSKQEWLDKQYPDGYQLRKTSEFYIHPNYTKQLQFVSSYDVALVKVEPFQQSFRVATIKINTRPWRFDDYVSCIVTGFGKKHPEQEESDDFVRKTYYLEAESPCPCLKYDKTTPKLWICTKRIKDFGVCQTERGAALVCNTRIRALAVDVLSYKNIDSCTREKHSPDNICGSEKSLGVFQNTFPCIRWMNKHLKQFKMVMKKQTNDAKKLHSLVYLGLYVLIEIFVLSKF